MNINEIMSDPRYQKAIRKRMATDPRNKAIPDISDVVAIAGKEAGDMETSGKARAAELTDRGAKLGIAEGKAGIREAQYKLDTKTVGLGEGRLALEGEKLAGDKANTAAVLEFKKDLSTKEIELEKQKISDEIEAKKRDLSYLTDLRDAEKGQGETALGLSVLNLGLKGAGAYYDLKQSEKQDLLLQNEMKKREAYKEIAAGVIKRLNELSGYNKYQ